MICMIMITVIQFIMRCLVGDNPHEKTSAKRTANSLNFMDIIKPLKEQKKAVKKLNINPSQSTGKTLLKTNTKKDTAHTRILISSYHVVQNHMKDSRNRIRPKDNRSLVAL